MINKMVICNIVFEKEDEVIKKYKDVEFINFADKYWKIKNILPTLIYGYKFAKRLFPEEVKSAPKEFHDGKLLYVSY